MAETIKKTWQKEVKQLSSSLEAQAKLLHATKPTEYNILRVNQLDAQILDQELTEILKMQFMKVFSLFNISSLEPELEALLNLTIFRISIYALDRTYGQQLQNLQFGGLSRMQKYLFGILLILGRYIQKRGEPITHAWATYPSGSTYKRLWTFISRLETIFKVAELLNFIVFLWNGKYVSLINRVLMLNVIYLRSSMARRVSFEYMNRQLVWNGFTEFMLFIMPMINVDKMKTLIKKTFSAPHTSTNIDPFTCPICTANPIQTPYISNCGHKFCYYCLKVALMTDRKYTCPICEKHIHTIKRWQPND